jgi:two-component system osmolarity sensor histidine kinase EnvZ
VYASNLSAMAISIRALPAERQDEFLDSLAHLSGGTVVADDPLAWGLIEPKQLLVKQFLAGIRERLPAYSIGFTPGNPVQLWIALPLGNGRTRWVRLALPTHVPVPATTVFLLLGLLVLTASAGSAYLLIVVRRRLAWVASALDGVDPRTGQPAGVAPSDAPDDAAELGRHFHQLTDRLGTAQAERSLLMSGISGDLRKLVQRLREAQPRAMSPEAARCLAEMERVTAQFDDFAHAASGESVQPLDINPLIVELVAQITTRMPGVPIRTELGGLPYIGLRPSSARRMLANLLDNAVRHGGQGVEVATALEQGWVVVRLRDRGAGVAAHELPLIGRPFYRTDAARARGPGSGLGVAIARHEAEAHGGSLRLSIRPGGGLQAELWLRPARLE